MVEGSGIKIQGSGFRVYGSRFRVYGSGLGTRLGVGAHLAPVAHGSEMHVNPNACVGHHLRGCSAGALPGSCTQHAFPKH